MNQPIKAIDITPTWEEAAAMLIRLLEAGDFEGRAYARSEILRMGKIIDGFKEHLK